LTRVTSDVVEYRSVVLFKVDAEGKLDPAFQSSPDRLTARDLAGKREPLVAKAWLHDRAYRGTASAVGQRMLAAESQLVAVPLKPAGVLYFGRDDDQPFSKAEASKLFFVVRRARAGPAAGRRGCRHPTGLRRSFPGQRAVAGKDGFD
jgi:hypothetical protein